MQNAISTEIVQFFFCSPVRRRVDIHNFIYFVCIMHFVLKILPAPYTEPQTHFTSMRLDAVSNVNKWQWLMAKLWISHLYINGFLTLTYTRHENHKFTNFVIHTQHNTAPHSTTQLWIMLCMGSCLCMKVSSVWNWINCEGCHWPISVWIKWKIRLFFFFICIELYSVLLTMTIWIGRLLTRFCQPILNIDILNQILYYVLIKIIIIVRHKILSQNKKY